MKESLRVKLTWILTIAFAALFTYGAFTDEVAIVMQKAAHICLECIGIG